MKQLSQGSEELKRCLQRISVIKVSLTVMITVLILHSITVS